METRAPILTINLESPTPVYSQVADGIRSDLVAGSLRPGNSLPTVRHLARSLGVHHNTVAKAYRLLAREGWLDLRRGRGAQVVARVHPAPSKQAETEYARHLRELVAKAVAQGVPKAAVAGQLKALHEELGETK
jgi:DNA-binding transcriptional regulator YhcF (GntR family)